MKFVLALNYVIVVLRKQSKRGICTSVHLLMTISSDIINTYDKFKTHDNIDNLLACLHGNVPIVSIIFVVVIIVDIVVVI